MNRRILSLLWVCSVAAAIALAGANLWFGAVNQDEGWYLYAARLVAEGKQPFVDFASTQGPVMSYGYALATPLVRIWGVLGGRLFTVILGFACSAAAAWLGARLAGKEQRGSAALMAFALTAVNVYQSYFFTIVKTYALASLLLVLGTIVLTRALTSRRAWQAFPAAALMAAAAATRVSLVFFLPVAVLVLLWRAMRTTGPDRRGFLATAAWFTAGGISALLLAYLPFVLQSPEGVWFGLVEYHAGRSSGSMTSQVAYKAGFISRVVRAYFVPVAICAFLVLRRWLQPTTRNRSTDETSTILGNIILVGVICVSLVHLLAPFPYDDYQVPLLPLFAAWLGAGLAREIKSTGENAPAPGQWLVAGVCLICIAAAFSSPMNEEWFVGKRDRIWWPLREKPALCVLRDTGEMVRELAGDSDVLLTQDPYLAIEAGLSVPQGMELGPFSYFPEWSREQAEARCVVNRDMLLEIIASTDAGVAAFSGYGLAIGCPAVEPLSESEQEALWSAVRARYSPHSEIDPFGQADTTLRVLVRKP